MEKTNKISNLKRLNLANKCVVLCYLFKTFLKIKPSISEIDTYVYYNDLINVNGFYLSETKQHYVATFKNHFNKIIKLRKRPSSDMQVFHQIYRGIEYAPVVKIYNENFDNPLNYSLNIIDAGSNIGLTSLFFIDNFNKVNLVCLEPEPENFKVMDFNLMQNNNNNIIKINGAIWSSNTYIEIVKDFRDKLDWSFRVEETNDVNAIQAFSINHLVEVNNFERIDILKIDIEGSEKQIFTSKDANLDFLKITKCIAIEIHDEFNCREDINTILTNYGFQFIKEGELTIGYNQNLINK